MKSHPQLSCRGQIGCKLDLEFTDSRLMVVGGSLHIAAGKGQIFLFVRKIDKMGFFETSQTHH